MNKNRYELFVSKVVMPHLKGQTKPEKSVQSLKK